MGANMTAKKNGKNKGGRPKFIIDWDIFDNLCFIQCTLKEITQVLRCSEDTIERRVKQEKGMSFADYYAQKKGLGKLHLRRLMMRQAEKNPAIVIFMAKNHLGMRDVADIEITTREVTAMSDKELEALVER